MNVKRGNPMKKISAVILTLVMLFAMCITAHAFDANDYDYGGGGDWDWGGSDWDWGDDDDDYSYGGGYSSWDDDDDDYSSGSSGDMTWEEMLITIIVVVAALGIGGFWASKPAKKGKNTQSYNNANRSRPKNVPNRNVEIRDTVRKFDPSFSADEMVSYATDTFVRVQNAWCARDLEPVRGLMHNNLYNTTKKQVQSKIDQHVTYHYENITISNAYLTSYVRDSEFEYVTAYLNVKYIDYQTNDDTGEIIKGDKTTMWHLRYLMKFMRSTSGTGSSEAPKFCPNCGAPLDIASSGKCEYCGSTVTSTSFDWLLSDFTTVRNDTKDDGIRV